MAITGKLPTKIHFFFFRSLHVDQMIYKTLLGLKFFKTKRIEANWR